LKNSLKFLATTLKDPEVWKGGKVDAPLLYLGLVYREVSRAVEFEPEMSSNAPSYLENSPFTIKHLDQLGKLIADIQFPSSQ
jgi:hypothetical protein